MLRCVLQAHLLNRGVGILKYRYMSSVAGKMGILGVRD